jgi:hypothetical protein
VKIGHGLKASRAILAQTTLDDALQIDGHILGELANGPRLFVEDRGSRRKR